MNSVHVGDGAGQTSRAHAWSTNVTATSDEHVHVRGVSLEDAIGTISFPGMLLRLWRGDAPTDAESELLGACLVATIDHGPLAPSALVARTIASTRATPMSALAGGILSFGDLHGAVVSRAMVILKSIFADEDIDTWASRMFQAERNSGRRLPGIGHRWHTTDLRAERLLAVAGPLADERHVAAMRALAACVTRHAGRSVAVNIDGALAVALTALRLDPEYGDFAFAIARSCGLAAHIVEERTRERPMRLIDPTAASYDGIPVAESFQESGS